MKKLLYVALCCAAFLCSCKPVDEGKKLTPEESKDKFEKTAISLVDACPASDFDDLADFANFLVKNYLHSGANYDFSALTNWLEESVNSSFREGDSISYITFVLSQYTGKFTFTPNGITYEDAKDLSFWVTDDKNAEWVLRLESSGEVREFVNKDIEGTEVIVKIPEKVILGLTRNGKQMLKETLTYDISLSPNIDILKDKVSISHEFAIKDYIINLTNGVDGSTGKFMAHTSLSKNGDMLIQGSLMGEVDMTENDTKEITISNVKNLTISMDVMTAVQIRGSVKDVKAMIDACDYSTYNKEEVLAAVNTLNSLLALEFYYDNTSTLQGHFEVEEYEYKDYEGQTCWDIRPVIVFNDNSRYILEDYFNNDDFSNLIDNFDAFVELYEALIERVANAFNSEIQ